MSIILVKKIPDKISSYHEIDRFISVNDQVPYFKELWGEEYYKKIEDLWERQIQRYKIEEKPDCQWNEAILVMTYDYYLGPYVGLPERIKLQFYQWLLDSIKAKAFES